MEPTTGILPDIRTEPPPRWLVRRGFPKHRVRVACGSTALARDLDSDRDLAVFVAGVRLGLARRDPALLDGAADCDEDDQIRREGILVGFLAAGVVIAPAYAAEDPPYVLSCEDVEEIE